MRACFQNLIRAKGSISDFKIFRRGQKSLNYNTCRHEHRKKMCYEKKVIAFAYNSARFVDVVLRLSNLTLL